jgi:hypothetical protein
MASGLGITLLVLGLLLLVGAVDLSASVTDVLSPWVLGWTLLFAGLLARLSSLAIWHRRRRSRTAREGGRDN